MSIQEFEYRIDIVPDRFGGGVDVVALSSCIKQCAKEGWRLVTVCSNEIGKNSVSVGGIGVNNTIDQTVLFFERRIAQKSIASKSTFYVTKCNLHEPIVLHSVTICSDTTTSISLFVYCPNESRLSGIECAVEFTNIFGESIICEPICFSKFQNEQGLYHLSAPFPISLPAHISHAIGKVGIIVRKYILGGNIITVDSTALLTNDDFLEKNLSQLNVESLLTQLEALRSAGEICNFIKQIDADIFPTGIIAELESLARTERKYGNMKTDALCFIKNFLQADSKN